MAITTRIAPLYGGQKLFAALLCAVFGVWGCYDYWVKIPRQEQAFARYDQLKSHLDELEQRKARLQQNGQSLSQTDQDDLNQTNAAIGQLAPGGAVPVRVGKYNRPTQWVYIACLPFAPYFYWMFLKAKRQKYRLDDDGALHFEGDPQFHTGAWTKAEIADIDMSRWMAKSIAHVAHTDGRRLKLDAYLHKDLHFIIGAIASGFYPDQWDSQAKVVKPAEGEEVASGADDADEAVGPDAAS